MKKVALVTGANQGIGLATVEALLQKNISVILTARDEQKGKEALKRFENYKNCYFCQLDINDNKSIQNAKNFVEKKFGKLDILINNAAINYDTWHDVLNASLDEVKDTINTNLIGTWAVTQAFVPLMKKNNYGRIVNISSGAGSLSSQNGSTPGYSISKLALNSLTLQFSNKLKDDNILVNSVCPGWVRTSMGGNDASRTAKQASEGIVYLALLSNNSHNGKFFRDKKIISW